MWNSEFKDQLCPWGQTNRAGKQEATGAAGPGIKGSSRGGRGGYRLAGPQSRGQPHRPVSSVGIVCLPLSIVPSQRVRGRKEEKKERFFAILFKTRDTGKFSSLTGIGSNWNSFTTGWSVNYNSIGNLVDYNKVNPLPLLCPLSSVPRYSPKRNKNRCTCA